MGTIDYQGLTNSYTYMGWQLITAPDSQQYKLREEAGMNFDDEGFGKINECYVIACTTHYGQVGDYIDWVLANGDTLHTIIGDIKSPNDSNYNEYGHVHGNSLNVVEFVVDYNSWYPSHSNPGNPGNHPEWAGLIQSYENIGDYWSGRTGLKQAIGIPMILVTGTRYDENKEWNCIFMGTLMRDGYVYFNDDKYWRCKEDGSSLQLLTTERKKNLWTQSNSIKNLQVQIFNALGAYGNGAISPNANVEAAVQWAINKCNNEYITYSNYERNVRIPNGKSYDCSSFIITAFYVGGYNADFSGLVENTWGMKEAFTRIGFQWIPMNTIPANACQRGDILLREYGGPGDGHTQLYIGNNQDANCGGTPARIVVHEEYGYGYGWDGILRAPYSI